MQRVPIQSEALLNCIDHEGLKNPACLLLEYYLLVFVVMQAAAQCHNVKFLYTHSCKSPGTSGALS